MRVYGANQITSLPLDTLLRCILLTCWEPVLQAGKAFPPAVFYKHGLKMKHFKTTMTSDTRKIFTLLIFISSLLLPWLGATTEAAVHKGKVTFNDARL